MRSILAVLIAASVVFGHASLTSAQRLVLTRTFTNPAPAGGDLFGPHQFGTSVGWLDGKVLVGAPGVDFGQFGQGNFLGDHGKIYLFDAPTGALLGSVSPSTRVQQAGFSVAGVAGKVLAGGPSVCCFNHSGAFLLDPTTGAEVRSFVLRDVFLGFGTDGTQFGFAVAPVGVGGSMVAAGAPQAEPPNADPNSNSGAAFIYDPGNALPLLTLLPPSPISGGRFGSAITAVGDDKILIGAPGMNRAFLFQIGTGALLTTVGPVGVEFGASVATVGDNLIIGAPGTGQRQGFLRVTTQSGTFVRSLPEFSELTEPGGRFGAAVAGFGVHVLAGAPASDSAYGFVNGRLVPIFFALTDAGVVYLHDLIGNLLSTLMSPNPQPGEMFGASIAVFGNQVLIGAPGADGGRGAVYLFEDPLPVAVAQTLSASEDTPLAITLQATDNDGGIVYAIVSPPSNGTLSGTPPNVSYSPRANFNGADQFTFKATDSSGFDSNVATVSITVAPVNDPPVALGQSVTTPANTSLQITLRATDVDGDPLSFLLLSQPGNGTLSGTPPNLTYTPKSGFLGADGFTFRANDGKALSNLGTVKITVLPGLTIDDVTSKEGNSGTTVFAFTVRLSVASTQNVFVKFSTADSTAVAGQDYVATSGTLTFAPGETTKTIKVFVIGDQLFEPDERFLVVLSAPDNALIVRGIGVGTIVNDDPILGVAVLVPQTATTAVREHLALDLTWTHPEAWRNLRSIDLRIVDDRGVILWVRFHEGRDTLSLVLAANDRSDHESENVRLETSAATLYLAESDIIKNDTQSVTLRFEVSFKPSAAGRVYRVEAAATDDAGNQQGFERVGTLEVRR